MRRPTLKHLAARDGVGLGLAALAVILGTSCGNDQGVGRAVTTTLATTTTAAATTTVTVAPTSAAPTTEPIAVTAPSTTAATTLTTASAPATAPATTPPSQDAAYVFPIKPADAADYARDHHDYPAADIFATCGLDFVAPIDGTISEVSRVDSWDSATDDPALRGGLSVTLVGADGVRYYGSHLRTVTDGIEAGVKVTAGQTLGTVGDTGNAAGTGCHVHFGISPPCGTGDWEVRRGKIWPWPYLDAWRSGESKSPAAEIAELSC